MNTMSPYDVLERLCQTESRLYKSAADGLHSNVPDDPEGDSTVDPTTGAYAKNNDKEVRNYEFVDVTAMDDGQENDGNVKDSIPNMGTDVAEVDDILVDDYNTEVPDYGTDTPVKTSSAHFAQCTWEENRYGFEKAASALLQDMRERAAYYGGNMAKSAGYYGDVPMTEDDVIANRLRVTDLIKQAAIRDAEFAAEKANYIMMKNAEGEEVDDEDTPIDTIEDTIEDAEDEGALEDLQDLPEEDIETLLEASDPELDLIQELAEAVDNGDIDAEDAVALITGDDDEVDDEDYDDEGDDEIDEEDIEDLADEATSKEAAWHYWRMKAAEAEAMADAIANDAGGEDGGDFSEEDLGALDQLPDEDVEGLIALQEAIDNGEIDPEIVEAALEGDPEVLDALQEAAGEEGGMEEDMGEAPVEDMDTPVSEDEAAGEMSSALEESGLTPEHLDQIAEQQPDVEKAASLRIIANGTRRYRTKHASYHYCKSARQMAIRRKCHETLAEMTR